MARLDRPSARSERTSRSRSLRSSSSEPRRPPTRLLTTAGVEGGSSRGDALDGVEESRHVANAILEQVADARRVVADQLEHVGRLEVLGEHEDRHGRVRASDLGRRDAGRRRRCQAACERQRWRRPGRRSGPSAAGRPRRSRVRRPHVRPPGAARRCPRGAARHRRPRRRAARSQHPGYVPVGGCKVA